MRPGQECWPLITITATKDLRLYFKIQSHPYSLKLLSCQPTFLQSVTKPPGTSLGSSGFACSNLKHLMKSVKYTTLKTEWFYQRRINNLHLALFLKVDMTQVDIDMVNHISMVLCKTAVTLLSSAVAMEILQSCINPLISVSLNKVHG